VVDVEGRGSERASRPPFAFAALVAACALNVVLVARLVDVELPAQQAAVSLAAVLAMLEAWTAGRVLEERRALWPELVAGLSTVAFAALAVGVTWLGASARLGAVGWLAAGASALCALAAPLRRRSPVSASGA